MYNNQTFKESVQVLKQAALSGDNRLSIDLKDSINAGQTYFGAKTHYVKKDMTLAGGRTLILDSTTDKVAGVSSIQGSKLPKKEAMAYNGIRLSYGTGKAADLGSSKLNKSFPDALLNAVLHIKQNGRTQLEVLVSDLEAESAPDNANNNYYGIPTNLLRDDEEIEVSLEFPKGVSMPDEDGSEMRPIICLQFRGVVTR